MTATPTTTKASLFRRVTTWAKAAPRESVLAYLQLIQDKQSALGEGRRRTLRWLLLFAAVFEFAIASHLTGISLGPLEIRNFSLVIWMLPAVLAYLVSALLMCVAVHHFLRVSESACIRVVHEVPWLLGIEFGLRDLGSLEDREIEHWGQPLDSARHRRALATLDWVYSRFVGVLLVFYAPVAVVRAGFALGTDHAMWWISALFVPVALLRGVFFVKHAAGVWRADDDLHPLAHLVSDEEIERYREKHQRDQPSTGDEA